MEVLVYVAQSSDLKSKSGDVGDGGGGIRVSPSGQKREMERKRSAG